MLKKKTSSVLVTGSCGFIGKNLLEKLLKSNLYLIGSYNRNKNFVKNTKINYFQINTSNRSHLDRIPVPETIVHLSNKVFTSQALKLKKKIDFNDSINSMRNILEFCKDKKVKKLIYVSSSTGYPKSNNKLNENLYFDRRPSKENFQVGLMSRKLEKIISKYSKKRTFKTKIIILRPSAIYGKYDNFKRYPRLIPQIIKKACSNKSYIKIPGSGSYIRNWISVTEFVNLITKLIFFNINKKLLTVNISSDKNYSTMEVVKKILKILNKKNFIIKKTSILEKKINKKMLDNSKMKALGLSVDNKTFDFHLKETISWYNNSK